MDSASSQVSPWRAYSPFRLALASPGLGELDGRGGDRALGLMAPAAVHCRHAQALHAERAHVLAAACARTPERFVRRPPTPPELPSAAWINKPNTKEVAH